MRSTKQNSPFVRKLPGLITVVLAVDLSSLDVCDEGGASESAAIFSNKWSFIKESFESLDLFMNERHNDNPDISKSFVASSFISNLAFPKVSEADPEVAATETTID